MGVAEGEPEAGLSGRRADHRTRIRKARTASHPGLGLDLIAERKQAFGKGHQPVKLDRRRRRVARGEFGAGGEADALLHRRQHIADIRVEHRPREAAAGARAEMQMIAALDGHRQPDPERREQVRRPRTERHHRVGGVDRPLGRIDAPARAGAMQRRGVAHQRDAAQGGEARRIGTRERERVGDAGRALHVDRVLENRPQRRLERARAIGIEHPDRDAEMLGDLPLVGVLGEAFVVPIDFQPAGLAHQLEGAGLPHQRLVLADRATEQRPHHPRRLGQTLGLRPGAEGQEPRRDLRQEGEMVIGFGRPFERDPDEGRQPRRESRRKNRVALDDARIAVGGLLARGAAIDQRDAQSPFCELQRDRGADDAGTEHDGIGSSHGSILATARWEP